MSYTSEPLETLIKRRLKLGHTIHLLQWKVCIEKRKNKGMYLKRKKLNIFLRWILPVWLRGVKAILLTDRKTKTLQGERKRVMSQFTVLCYYG